MNRDSPETHARRTMGQLRQPFRTAFLRRLADNVTFVTVVRIRDALEAFVGASHVVERAKLSRVEHGRQHDPCPPGEDQLEEAQDRSSSTGDRSEDGAGAPKARTTLSRTDAGTEREYRRANQPCQRRPHGAIQRSRVRDRTQRFGDLLKFRQVGIDSRHGLCCARG
jgi:hypothetical protein